jgi:hypothetical protein
MDTADFAAAAEPCAHAPAGLASGVSDLLASLNLPGRRVDPDAIVTAVLGIHDQLLVARDALRKQALDLKAREAALAEREAACLMQEAKSQALARLCAGLQLDMAAPKGGLLRRVTAAVTGG